VLVGAPAPANDTADHHAAVTGLIEDLAKLAAELYFAGRMDANRSEVGLRIGNKTDERDI
jgi:hypothetical protein